MDEANNDPIGKSLGLTPINTNDAVKTIINTAHNDSAINDFEMARANIHEMIETAKDAVNKLSMIAISSQHPRAFEVLAKLIDTGVQANKNLLELQSKIRELKQADQPLNDQARTVHNHNNLFVGSTAELQKVIADMRKQQDNE